MYTVYICYIEHDLALDEDMNGWTPFMAGHPVDLAHNNLAVAGRPGVLHIFVADFHKIGIGGTSVVHILRYHWKLGHWTFRQVMVFRYKKHHLFKRCIHCNMWWNHGRDTCAAAASTRAEDWRGESVWSLAWRDDKPIRKNDRGTPEWGH